MVYARDLEAYIHFVLMYMTYNIFPELPIKYLINEDIEPNPPFKLATSTKRSISHLRVLFCPIFVKKSTAHVGTKLLSMRHQAQKCFCGILVGIPQHQKGYLVYITHKRKILSSYNFFLMRVFLLCWRTHPSHMLNLWICNQLCYIYHM